jgi:hypothetical protein
MRKIIKKKLTFALLFNGFSMKCPILPCFLLAVALLSASCNKDVITYAEQLEAQQKSISKFIDNNGFLVIDSIPSNVPWEDSEGRKMFYLSKSGLYLHVVDTGRQAGKTVNNTLVCVRYTECSMEGDTTYSNMDYATDPIEIYFNTVSTGTGSSTYYWGDCKAWHEPLNYVGDLGHVMIIAPASVGMPYYSAGNRMLARYYDLRYTFWK